MIVGNDLTVKAIREGKKLPLVLIACDASDNSKKRALDCCAYHGVAAAELPHTAQELGHLVKKGSSVAAVGILDEGFAAALQREMNG